MENRPTRAVPKGGSRANSTEARLGRFASDAQAGRRRGDDHAWPRPAHITPCLAPLGEAPHAPHARLPYRHGDARPGRHPDPLPVSDQPLTCRANPALFAIEDVSSVDNVCARENATTQAKQACSGCPVVTQCLKWGLANPDLPQTGVWAATTKRVRKRLHKQLVARLGDNCELPFVSASATRLAPVAAEPADLPRPTFAPPLH
ncbi:WhiB family transcriptional regulator [Streptomyces microflavus]